MNKDLTVGKPFKVLFAYSLPLFGSIIFQQLYNVADSFVAGHYLGTSALAAVGNSYEVTLIYIAFAFGLNIGVSVVVARYFGAKDYRSTRTTAYTSLIASLVIGVVLTGVGIAVSKPLLILLDTPAEILEPSLEYLYIYLAGFIFVLIYNIATGIFSALGDSITPFIFLAASSLGNIGADILFVKCFDIGVASVAWATFMCQGLSGVLALICVLLRLKKMNHEGKAKAFDFKILGEVTKIAVPSILQQGAISVGNLVIQRAINGFGTSAIAGYAAAIKLNNLAITSMLSFGNGMSNFASQNFGAGKPDRIRRGYKAELIMIEAMAVLFAIVFIFAATPLTKIFITDGDADAIKASVQFLTYVPYFFIFVGVKMASDGVLRGTGHMTIFMIGTFTDLLLRVILSLSLAPSFGLMGIWYAWPVGWAVGGIITCSAYFVTRKRGFAVIEHKKHHGRAKDGSLVAETAAVAETAETITEEEAD